MAVNTRAFLLAMLVGWMLSASAQAEVKWVTFRVDPQDAEIFLEAGTDKPYSLGLGSNRIPLDLELFDGRKELRLTFHRAGYFDETRTLQSPPVQARYFDSRDVYPPPEEGPVRLSPRTDFASRLIQLTLFGKNYRIPLIVLLLVTAAVSFLGLRKWRAIGEQARRVKRMDELTVSLDSSDPFSGKLLGRYRVLNQLGSGGMSLVYRAILDNAKDSGEREVAIKVLDPKLAASLEAVKRFRREMVICTSLQHPNIVPIYEFGEQESVLYLVLELLKGQTLGDRTRGRPVQRSEIASWVEFLVKALSYLHSKQIVHRDLKPDNVFLTESGKLKLMDFGIARGEAFTVATGTHQGLGTPAYMSPEQVEGSFTAASDQYSLGCMVYEWLTGEPPFVDPDPFALAFKHVGQKPRSLRIGRSDISQQLDEVVLRLLAKTPDLRFSDIDEAGARLREALLM